MTHGNGQNGKPHSLPQDAVDPTSMEEGAVALRHEEEALKLVEEEPGLPDHSEDDVLLAWHAKEPASLEDVHALLERVAIQVNTIAAKVETTAHHVDQVDSDVARGNATLREVRKDMQFIKDNVAEMRAPVAQIPAIKDLLGEILARLPEPEPHAELKVVK